MANERKLVAQLLIELGNSIQNLQEVRDAALASGDAGAKAADLFTERFGQIEDAAQRVWQKITDGSKVTGTEMAAAAQQLAQVEAAAIQAFGSIENAPEPIQRA